jgi:SH3-like domain-containing protein
MRGFTTLKKSKVHVHEGTTVKTIVQNVYKRSGTFDYYAQTQKLFRRAFRDRDGWHVYIRQIGATTK